MGFYHRSFCLSVCFIFTSYIAVSGRRTLATVAASIQFCFLRPPRVNHSTRAHFFIPKASVQSVFPMTSCPQHPKVTYAESEVTGKRVGSELSSQSCYHVQFLPFWPASLLSSPPYKMSRYRARISSTTLRAIGSRSLASRSLPLMTLAKQKYTEINRYQPGGSQAFGMGSDPLSNGTLCLRDAALMQSLGINAIRTYNVDPTLNHDECASIFNAVITGDIAPCEKVTVANG